MRIVRWESERVLAETKASDNVPMQFWSQEYTTEYFADKVDDCTTIRKKNF